MDKEKIAYIADCIEYSYRNRRDELEDVEDLADNMDSWAKEYDDGWRLAEGGNGYRSPQGRFIRKI